MLLVLHALAVRVLRDDVDVEMRHGRPRVDACSHILHVVPPCGHGNGRGAWCERCIVREGGGAGAFLGRRSSEEAGEFAGNEGFEDGELGADEG